MLAQGAGAGGAPVPLAQHKFGPHDVVDLRPSSGAGSGSALASGVVYRVSDTAIIVAVEEAPEEGLEQPLRLEKLANEVWCWGAARVLGGRFCLLGVEGSIRKKEVEG